MKIKSFLNLYIIGLLVVLSQHGIAAQNHGPGSPVKQETKAQAPQETIEQALKDSGISDLTISPNLFNASSFPEQSPILLSSKLDSLDLIALQKEQVLAEEQSRFWIHVIHILGDEIREIINAYPQLKEKLPVSLKLLGKKYDADDIVPSDFKKKASLKAKLFNYLFRTVGNSSSKRLLEKAKELNLNLSVPLKDSYLDPNAGGISDIVANSYALMKSNNSSSELPWTHNPNLRLDLEHAGRFSYSMALAKRMMDEDPELGKHLEKRAIVGRLKSLSAGCDAATTIDSLATAETVGTLIQAYGKEVKINSNKEWFNFLKDSLDDPRNYYVIKTDREDGYNNDRVVVSISHLLDNFCKNQSADSQPVFEKLRSKYSLTSKALNDATLDSIDNCKSDAHRIIELAPTGNTAKVLAERKAEPRKPLPSEMPRDLKWLKPEEASFWVT